MTENRTILFVDDVQMFRDLGALFLARVGRVITAKSGGEALEIASRERPDVMLVDLSMPGMDGDEVCRELRTDRKLRDTPLIMLVGDDSPSEWGRAVRSGANDVLSKPLSRVSLNSSVSRFLRDGPLKGLQRVEMNLAVELKLGQVKRWGKVRNLSRGGVFIETDCTVFRNTEVELSFILPESDRTLTSTAHVIWQRLGGTCAPRNGIGMRFVDISGESIRSLEDFVFDRAIGPSWQPVGMNP